MNKAIVYALISTIFAAIGQIAYKYASNGVSNIQTFILNPYVYIGIIFYGIGFIFMLKALLYGEVTLVYPMMSMVFIWVAILSPILFKTDSMSVSKWIGIGIILLGTYFVAKGGKK